MTCFLPQLSQDAKKLLSSNLENEIIARVMVLRFSKF